MVTRALVAAAALLGLAAGPARAARALSEAGGAPGGRMSARIESRGRQRPADQPSPPAAGLSHECLTYEQRYDRHQYHTGLAHSHLRDARHRDSKYVVLLKMHRAFKDRMPLDVVLNIRAMASELTAAKYHFYILYQPPTGPDSLSREEVLELVPIDLRPFLVVHDHEDDYAMYPALAARDDPKLNRGENWGLGPRAEYLAVVRFTRRYRYEYVWVLEWDIRYTGRSWGEFLNAALSLAQQAPAQELVPKRNWLADERRVASRALPASTEGLPDLLAFDGFDEGSHWIDLVHNLDAKERIKLLAMKANVFMGSRRLWDLAHEYSLRGVGSHLETALATMAVERGLKLASIRLPANETFPGYMDCCSRDAPALYAAWHNSTACAPSLLLHPVKTDEPWWPSLALQPAAARQPPGAQDTRGVT